MRVTDLSQAGSVGCSTLTGGITRIWLVDNLDISAFVCTETITKAEWSAVTLGAANKMFSWTFTKDNTAFANAIQANIRENAELTIFFNLNGITPEKIDNLNGLRAACGITAFVEYASGTIVCFGRDYDVTSNANSEIPKPLELKGQILSGLGNGDSEKVVVELVGAAKYFPITTTLTASALDAL